MHSGRKWCRDLTLGYSAPRLRLLVCLPSLKLTCWIMCATSRTRAAGRLESRCTFVPCRSCRGWCASAAWPFTAPGVSRRFRVPAPPYTLTHRFASLRSVSSGRKYARYCRHSNPDKRFLDSPVLFVMLQDQARRRNLATRLSSYLAVHVFGQVKKGSEEAFQAQSLHNAKNSIMEPVRMRGSRAHASSSNLVAGSRKRHKQSRAMCMWFTGHCQVRPVRRRVGPQRVLLARGACGGGKVQGEREGRAVDA